MKATIESTTRMVQVNGVPARIWEGRTESGIEIILYVALVAHAADAPPTEFEKELRIMKDPSPKADAVPDNVVTVLIG